MNWYGVRCVFRFVEGTYEERVTLWRANDFDHAIAKAEGEAARYALEMELEYLGLAQAFLLTDEPGEAAEVFSLLRDSALDPEDYLTAFFNTGRERQGDVELDRDEPSL